MGLLYLNYHKLKKKLGWDGIGEGKRLFPWKEALDSSPHWHHSCCSNYTSCQHTCLSCSPVSCFHTHKISHWPGYTLLTIQSKSRPGYSWTYPCFSEYYFFNKPNSLVKQSLVGEEEEGFPGGPNNNKGTGMGMDVYLLITSSIMPSHTGVKGKNQ